MIKVGLVGRFVGSGYGRVGKVAESRTRGEVDTVEILCRDMVDEGRTLWFGELVGETVTERLGRYRDGVMDDDLRILNEEVTSVENISREVAEV